MPSWPQPKLGLRVTPQVMHKLQWLVHEIDTEVLGFGIVKEEDPLMVLDFVLIPQECTAASVDIEGADIAEYIDSMSDSYKQTECRSVCIHTHPKMAANPSTTDESMFAEVYPETWPWSVMAILSKTGDFYARLKIPRFRLNHKIPFGLETVDWSVDTPNAETIDDWRKEVDRCVKEPAVVYTGFQGQWDQNGRWRGNNWKKGKTKQMQWWQHQQAAETKRLAEEGKGEQKTVASKWEEGFNAIDWDSDVPLITSSANDEIDDIKDYATEILKMPVAPNYGSVRWKEVERQYRESEFCNK